MKIKTIFLGLIAALAMTTAMGREAPLQDSGRIAVVSPSATPVTQEMVRSAIITASQKRDWQVTKDEPGKLTLKYDKQGKHIAIVEASYDATGFELKYLESTNLNYAEKDGVRMIHPNYNHWIQNLVKDIPINLVR